MGSSTKAIVEQKEAAFQECLKEYDSNPNKKTWDALWPFVQDACMNMAKSKCWGIKVLNLEDKVMDATIKIMQKIKEGTRPEKLSSFCYLYVIGQLWNVKLQREEREEDLDSFLDDKVYRIGLYNEVEIFEKENENE